MNKTMNFLEYRDKIHGCFAGKTIGGTLGAPFECFRGVFDIDRFMQDVSVPIPNDDVDLQLVWLRAAETEGKNLDSHTLAEYWNTYISASLSEYGTGKSNFNMGILPPLSGHMRNVNCDSNGAWIRTEIWACLCAGNPAHAAKYAYYDACVDHSGEGIYSAVFIAAMEAAAFFEKDYDTLIDIGLSYIPEDCGVARAVRCVRKCYADGLSWKEARIKLFQETPSSFGEIRGIWKGTKEVPACKECPAQDIDPNIPEAVYGYDAPWSMGAILIGLLYGEGDYGKAICIATNLGEDTDCTAGTLGALLGIIEGKSGIPAYWKDTCSEKIVTWTLRIDCDLKLPSDVSELVERILRLAPEFLGKECKFGTEGYTVDCVSGFYSEQALCGCIDYPREENIMELIAEHPYTVRKHFGLYTALVCFDETLAKIEEGLEKKICITFKNMLLDPQYLTIRFLDVPEEWEMKGGAERCVGIEHFHGGRNDNAVDISFTPQGLTKGKYTIVMEISSNGRMTKNYVPITFINGSC